MLLSRYLRRRTIVKFLLIGLVAYTFYISLAAFGTLGGLNDGGNAGDSGNNNKGANGEGEKPLVPEPPPIPSKLKVREIIDQNDNMKDYDKIKKNG